MGFPKIERVLKAYPGRRRAYSEVSRCSDSRSGSRRTPGTEPKEGSGALYGVAVTFGDAFQFSRAIFRSRSKFARPYMSRLRYLILQFLPSRAPLLKGRASPAVTRWQRRSEVTIMEEPLPATGWYAPVETAMRRT